MSSIETIGSATASAQTSHSESSAKAAGQTAEYSKDKTPPPPPQEEGQTFSAYDTVQSASSSTVKGVNVVI